MTSFWFGLSARGWAGLVGSGCSNGISQAFVPHSSGATSPRPVSGEGALCPHLAEGSESSGVHFIRALAPLIGAPPPHTTALGVRISVYGSGDIQCPMYTGPMYTDPMYRSVATAAIALWSRRGLSAPAGSSPRPQASTPKACVAPPLQRSQSLSCPAASVTVSGVVAVMLGTCEDVPAQPSPASNGEWSRQSGRMGRSHTA